MFSDIIIQIIQMDYYIIPLIILIIIYIILIIRVISFGIRVVHQGTFIIVERFGVYHVGPTADHFLYIREL